MHKTALEMYSDAYNLHYKLGDIEKAKKIYEEIIEGYPVSDAADYSAIQLKSIKENAQSGFLNDTATVSVKSNNFPVVISILTLIITVAILVFGFFYIKRTELKLKNITDLTMAQNKIATGNLDEALLILGELKIKSENNVLPFVLASDIYADKKDFKKARQELQTFQRINPANEDIKTYLRRLDDKEAIYLKEKRKLEKEKVEKLTKKVQVNRSRYVSEPEPKVKKVKREDISYF